MNLRHETRAQRGETRTLPGARHESSSLPALPAVSATATACPGRGRDGRVPFGLGRQLLRVELPLAVPRDFALGARDSLVERVGVGGGQDRALEKLVRAVVVEPVLARLEAGDHL